MRKSLLGLGSIVVLLGACGGPAAGPATPAVSATAADAAPTATAPELAAAPTSAPESEPPSNVELQKAVMKAREAAWAAHDVDQAMAVYAPGAKVSHVGPAGWTVSSLPEVKADLAAMFAAFPDAKLTVTRIISTSDRAAAEWTMTGTNKGEFMGQKPTDKPFGIRGACYFHIDKEGKITRESQYFDVVTIQGQIGTAPRHVKVRPVEPVPTAPLEVLVSAPGNEPTAAEVLKKLYERTQMRDHAGMAALVAEDGVISNSYEAEDMTKAAMVKSLPAADRAFKNPGSVVTGCVSAGDLAACEYEWTATWKGPAMNMAPTGKTGKVHELDVVRVKDGQLARIDGYGNAHEFLVSFGVVKLPEPAKTP